jgi:hypothetical protein
MLQDWGTVYFTSALLIWLDLRVLKPDWLFFSGQGTFVLLQDETPPFLFRTSP